MSSAAERARRKKLATIARAEETRIQRATNQNDIRAPAAPKTPSERKGLEWLLSKKRITARQFWAGTEYGILYRAVGPDGVEPLRSNLNQDYGGGSTGDEGKWIPGMSSAGSDIDRKARLAACHTIALRSETNMIATCAAVCGRQLTPREITTDHAETVEIETTLRLALNLLADHLEKRAVAA